jgi:uncharacterized protein
MACATILENRPRLSAPLGPVSLPSWRLVVVAIGILGLLTSGQAVAVSPKAAQAAEAREVTVATPNPKVRLAGTLSMPGRSEPFPAIVLIQGQGPHTRDQMISGSPMFRMIADELTKGGFAVLRLDKRGVGKSTGPSADESTFADLAGDISAAVAFLRQEPEIDRDCIGLLGHSEGAIIAPIVATGNKSVKFVVLIAPTAVPGGEVWMRQSLFNLKSRGASAAELAAIAKQMVRLVDFVKGGKNDDETYYKIGHDFIAAHGMAENKISRKLVDQFLSDFRSTWQGDFFRHDPSRTLQRLTTPTLAVFGAIDHQVPADQNLGPLVAALVASRNADFTLTVLPDCDHFFLTYEGHRVEKHVFGKMEISSDLMRSIRCWLSQRAGRHSVGGDR